MSDVAARSAGQVQEAGPSEVGARAFSPKIVLALILVGVFSFSAFMVLSAYAPDLRRGSDGRAHALSQSAIGYAGAVVMLNAEGVPTVVSRSTSAQQTGALLIATPEIGDEAKALQEIGIHPPPTDSNKTDSGREPGAPNRRPALIVMPKWQVMEHPVHRGWVLKARAAVDDGSASALLKDFSPKIHIDRRKGRSTPRLQGAGGAFAKGVDLTPGTVDQLQTISGAGWSPLVVDDAGRAVLVGSSDGQVFVLSDPDLLNTQGLADLRTARTGMAIVNGLRLPNAGVVFDVTLNGFKRSRSLLRLMLEPPLLGATLCALAATILAGLHALVRFGPPLRRGRAVALGKAALVDNSAGLIRMSGKEAHLAPAYADEVQALVAKATGTAAAGGPARTQQLARLGQAKRSTLDLQTLIQDAAQVRNRADLLACARKLHQWRLEITRERE